ncbi:DUF2834 domain-containing protein [Alteromonas sp. ASW11-36]|uniref:DUF2834 domain-containing protein n=1 Tax=Alteromonas arenosi TaxID=3055817 RepID=A0ABT7SVX5_9ALTE|nr:DUF2834 domain-containing protein [Alteromonas sp. ASW11-36]MDM7860349.1 DUF2834 domain-containing protein [Alteromonas sp. ASW11-36]
MNVRLILLLVTLALFGAYSGWLLLDVGYIAIWQAGFANPSSLQILIDLVIACLIITSWMIGDAKARGITVWPWIVAVLTTGTLAILVYLVVRELAKKPKLQTA